MLPASAVARRPSPNAAKTTRATTANTTREMRISMIVKPASEVRWRFIPLPPGGILSGRSGLLAAPGTGAALPLTGRAALGEFRDCVPLLVVAEDIGVVGPAPVVLVTSVLEEQLFDFTVSVQEISRPYEPFLARLAWVIRRVVAVAVVDRRVSIGELKRHGFFDQVEQPKPGELIGYPHYQPDRFTPTRVRPAPREHHPEVPQFVGGHLREPHA